jgi:transposase InsO family protein
LITKLKLIRIDQLWCSDITYIRILNGFVYLAAIIDVYSRKIVGYAIGKTLCPELTITALKMAIATRKTNNLIHHSDQGIQYTCKEYINILKAYHIKISMSAKGNPYDNAFVESFFKTLKQEEVYLWEYETFSDVIERIPYFIEDVYNVYNKKRLYSSLGYRPPEEYERLFAENDSQECIMAKTINVVYDNLKVHHFIN